MSFISVTSPYYNYKHYLEGAVSSVLDDQPRGDVLAPIIDDASTDDTAPQLQNMPKGYSRLAELRELRAVFDTVLERHQEVLDAPRDLSAGARRRLAREALWAAGRRQKQDWPRAAGLMASRKLQWRLRHRAWRHRGV
jgi:glycosyltransferase involved in cell wall biosynthesis